MELLSTQFQANKNDNLREESELNRANMTEWIDQLKEKIIHLEVSYFYSYNENDNIFLSIYF